MTRCEEVQKRTGKRAQQAAVYKEGRENECLLSVTDSGAYEHDIHLRETRLWCFVRGVKK